MIDFDRKDVSAFFFFFENFEYIPLTSNYILQFHKYFYQYANPDIVGKFKNVQNHIVANIQDGTSKTLFTPLSPIETPKPFKISAKHFTGQWNQAKLSLFF